jgi:UDP-N-acetylmuramyl pentapeptide synthase
VLITLGPRARVYAEAAREAGKRSPTIFEFSASEPVIEWLRGNLTASDTALLKGSHGLRMDLIVAAVEGRS